MRITATPLRDRGSTLQTRILNQGEDYACIVLVSCLAARAVALLSFGVLGSLAQQGGKGKGGFGFGGGGGMTKDPIALLQREDVKKELDLSAEQTEKLPGILNGAVMKAAATVLDDKQMKRFRQIDLQVRGNQAFVKDESLRKELKITDSQVKNIEEILANVRKEVEEIQKEAKESKNFKGMMEKVTGVNKEAKEKVLGVLNADQKKQYKEIVGEEFKFEEKKGKKKNDA